MLKISCKIEVQVDERIGLWHNYTSAEIHIKTRFPKRIMEILIQRLHFWKPEFRESADSVRSGQRTCLGGQLDIDGFVSIFWILDYILEFQCNFLDSHRSKGYYGSTKWIKISNKTINIRSITFLGPVIEKLVFATNIAYIGLFWSE